MTWTDFLAKLMEKQPIFLLLTGIGLILFAACGGCPPWHLAIAAPIWQWIIGGIGIICIGLAVLSFIPGLTRRQTTKQLQKKYGIRITSLQKGHSLLSPIRLWGTYNNLPPEKNLYAFEYNPETRLYWPKDKLSFDTSDQSWQTTMDIDSGDNKERILIIGYAGEDTLRLISYHKKITGRKIWEGIEEMPTDFHRLAQVQIVLRCPV